MNQNNESMENATLKIIELKDLKHRLNLVGIITLTSAVCYFTVSLLLSALIHPIIQNHSFAENVDSILNSLFSGFVNLFGLGVCGLLFIFFKKDKTQYQLPFEKMDFKKTLCLITIGFSVCMLANTMTSSFLGVSQSLGFDFNHSQSFTSSNSVIEIVLSVITVAIVPAVSEEILFRGAIMSTLRKYGDSTAILISTVIFGLFHGNLVQIPFAFIVGIVLGWVVTSTNSMLPAILIHFSNNLFSVICSALQNNHKSLGISISTINIFVTLFIIVMGILSLYFSVKLSRTDRSFLSLSNYYGELSKQEIKHAVITSPFLIASVIMLIFETVVNHIG